MISLNATLFVQVLLFLVLLFILNRVMIQPIYRIIQQREQYIADKKDEVADLYQELHQLSKKYQYQLSEIESEARRERRGFRDEANDQARKIQGDASEHVTEMKQRFRAEVLQELERARKQLKEQAEPLSFDVSERIVGRRI
jgi:F-type H+-transporting ATPase subunit b